ncbi:glycerophosphodiester phosphodiesterase family protein [Vibrio mediterranei]
MLKNKLFYIMVSVLFSSIANAGNTCTVPNVGSVTASKTTAQQVQNFEHYTPNSANIMMVPHRGVHGSGIPNNSLPAILEAIKLGADMVEIDVLMSSDGVPVLLHDQILESETNGQGKPHEHDASYLTTLKMKDPLGNVVNNAKVTTLEDAINLLSPCILFNIDVKVKSSQYDKDQAYQAISSVIRNTGSEDRVYLKGVYEYSDYTRIIGSDIKYTPKIGEEINNIDSYFDEWSLIALSKNSSVKGFEVRVKNDNSPFIPYIDSVHALKLRVGMVDVSWTNWSFVKLGTLAPNPVSPENDHRGDWDFLIQKKPDYVITDNAANLKGYLTISY